MPPIFPKSSLSTESQIFTDSKNPFGSGGSINKQLTHQSCQNIISLFWANETLCEVILLYDHSKCQFLQVEIFHCSSSKMRGVPNTALRGCVRPRYGVGPFLTSKSKCLNTFVIKSMTIILPGFFDSEANPLLNFLSTQKAKFKIYFFISEHGHYQDFLAYRTRIIVISLS